MTSNNLSYNFNAYSNYNTPQSSRVSYPFSPSYGSYTPYSRSLGLSRRPCTCQCTCTSTSSVQPSQSLALPTFTTSNSTQKRRRDDDVDKENTNLAPETPLRSQKRARVATEDASTEESQEKKIKENIKKILEAITVAGWGFSHFLYYVFRLRDEQGKPVSRDHGHASTVQKFLSGKTLYYPAQIIDAWFHSKDGRLGNDDSLMYLAAPCYQMNKLNTGIIVNFFLICRFLPSDSSSTMTQC